MVAIPVLKLFTMTVKTLAKPMSKRMKTEAQKHPTFRGVLNRMGQTTHVISTRISIRNAGHTTTKIKPLDEDKAIADGGDLLAEGFIYALGAFLMVFEYVSSANEKEEKEAKAKIKKEAEKRELAQTLEDINQRLARIEALDQRHNQTSLNGGKDRSAPPGGRSKGPGEGSTQGATRASAAGGNQSSSALPSGTASVSRRSCEAGLNGDDAGTEGFSTVQGSENAVGGKSVRDGDREDGDRSRHLSAAEVWGKERVAGPSGLLYLGLNPAPWNWAAVQSK